MARGTELTRFRAEAQEILPWAKEVKDQRQTAINNSCPSEGSLFLLPQCKHSPDRCLLIVQSVKFVGPFASSRPSREEDHCESHSSVLQELSSSGAHS